MYVSPNEDNRKVLWEKLIDIANENDKPWLVAGDFNDIAFANEKKGGGWCLLENVVSLEITCKYVSCLTYMRMVLVTLGEVRFTMVG